MSAGLDATRQEKLKAKAGYVGGAINIFQTLFKIGFGILGQSAALIADGVHSLSDLLCDFIVIIAVRLGSRKADREHPYGHRRFETIATGMLGVSLIVVGGGIAWSVMERMAEPGKLLTPGAETLAVAALSILINEWLYHYTKRIAGQTRSKLLLANAWHQRSDAISSVVVLFGIGAVFLGYPLADAAAAIVVAFMISKLGLNLVVDNIKEVVDTSLPSAVVNDIRSAIFSIDGVEDIHLLRTRQMGDDAFIDAHIVVDPRLTVSEAHLIGDIVRDDLITRFDYVKEVLVHVDPEDDQAFLEPADKPLTRRDVQDLLSRFLADTKPLIEDFRMHYLDGTIEIEIILPFAASENPQLLSSIKNQCERMQCEIKAIANINVFFKI
ncbi:MAG: cation diffusion facilitator family transporter [Gammaproteobacteria bacterium]